MNRKERKHVEKIEKIYALLREYIRLCEEFDKARRINDKTTMYLMASNFTNTMFDEAPEHDKANIRGDFGITLIDIQTARGFTIPEADKDFLAQVS